MQLNRVATERSGEDMRIEGRPCIITGCGPHPDMDLRLWTEGLTIPTTFAASTTNLHQLITATATTRTHHHTQGTTRVHRPLTEGEKKAGVAGLIITERWMNFCAEPLTGHEKGTEIDGTEDD